MSAPPSVREMRLVSALRRLVTASLHAEVVMRAGSCPKCRTKPAAAPGEYPNDFALSMCSTEDWCDIHDAVIEAESTLADVDLDTHRPGPASIRECEAALVQIDLALCTWVRP